MLMLIFSAATCSTPQPLGGPAAGQGCNCAWPHDRMHAPPRHACLPGRCNCYLYSPAEPVAGRRGPRVRSYRLCGGEAHLHGGDAAPLPLLLAASERPGRQAGDCCKGSTGSRCRDIPLALGGQLQVHRGRHTHWNRPRGGEHTHHSGVRGLDGTKGWMSESPHPWSIGQDTHSRP